MAPRFTISIDATLSIVRIWMSGFFLPDDVERFEAERNVAHQSLRCGKNEHCTLVDIREMAIQSQDTVAAFTKAMHTPEIYSRRIAIVVSASLARGQVKRASGGRDVQYFEDMEAAELWLFKSEFGAV